MGFFLDGLLLLRNGAESRKLGSRCGEIGINPQCLLIVLDGFRGATHFFQGKPQIVMRYGIIRFDLQGALEVFHRLGNPARTK